MKLGVIVGAADTSGGNDEWTFEGEWHLDIFAGKFSVAASVSREITIFGMAIGQLRARDFDRL